MDELVILSGTSRTPITVERVATVDKVIDQKLNISISKRQFCLWLFTAKFSEIAVLPVYFKACLF